MDWRLIFKQSAVNGGKYNENDLVQRVFRPVADSWFQKRLQHVRNEAKKEVLLEPSRSTEDH
jgi:hypothetical protein